MIDEDNLFDNGALEELESAVPLLVAMRQFGDVAANAAWFANLGGTFCAQSRTLADDYVERLGFGGGQGVEITPLGDWDEALFAAQTGDVNSPAWEAEEQARASLITQCTALADEEGLQLVLTYIAAGLDDILRECAISALYDMAGSEVAKGEAVKDEGANVLIGAAQKAVYEAAFAYGLHIMAQRDDNIEGLEFDRDSHPLYLKYRLFAAGHWPIAIIGQSFHIL